MIIGLNLDRELDSGHPEELSEYEWSYLYSSVPSVYDCQFCRHFHGVSEDGAKICDLYHCPYMERIYDVKEFEDDSYD